VNSTRFLAVGCAVLLAFLVTSSLMAAGPYTKGAIFYATSDVAQGQLVPGTAGHVLTSNGAGNLPTYQAGGSGSGTVTSVALTVPSEFSVAGSPVTTSGTLAVTWANPVAIANGGTNATTDSGARTNLGLAIGTNVQAFDAELSALASTTSAADKVPYFTGSGTATTATFTTAGRALVDDADATAQRATLSAAASGANTDITSVLLNQTGLVVKGGSSNALTIKPNETLTAGRTLNVVTNDADRTVNLAGNLTTAAALTTSGANALTLTTTGSTNVTLPTTGTLSTLAGAEKITGKTFGMWNYAVDSQANDSYVITLSPAITSYETGQLIIFKANTQNTTGCTINVNGLGAKTIVKRVNTTPATGDILASMLCLIVYDGTNFVLLNPVVN